MCEQVRKRADEKMVGREPAMIFNPNGIAASSPGLRGTSYPGSASKRFSTRKGLWQTLVISDGAIAATPSGLEKISNVQPRVAPSSQPWAGGRNPFGILEVRRRQLRNQTLSREAPRRIFFLAIPDAVCYIAGTST